MKNVMVVVLATVVSFFNSLHAKTWEQIVTEKTSLLTDDAYRIIKEQYAAFAEKRLPSIAVPVIKSITILERDEPLADVKLIENPRIIMLPDSPDHKPFAGPVYNSGLPNASKMRAEVLHRLAMVPRYLDELAAIFGYKPGIVTIKVFEGLRDLKTQEQLFQHMVEEVKVKDPRLNDDAAEAEASKWVSPVKNNIPVHSTGAAVDIRLWNAETETFLDLGPFGVIWGAKESAPTFYEGLTDVQKLNRLYLLMASAKAGLVNYPYEYWHFSTGDRYAVYWQEKDVTKRCAFYGAVK